MTKNKYVAFPKSFKWGAALSAEQSEGKVGIKKAPTIYDLHFAKRPADFYNQIDASITCDTIHRYKEDIKLMKEAGITSFRTSVSWARLFPDGMEQKPSAEAVHWYHDYIDECQRNGIEFILTLFHFDLPAYEQQKGGWRSLEVVEDFVKYADFIYKEFAKKVQMIVTMNEPQRPAINGYLTGRHWPLIKGDMKGFVEATYGIILAHCKAVNLFNSKYRDSGAKIGCIFDARHTYPFSESVEDKKAARISELLFYYGMVDPMVSGWFDSELLYFIKSEKLIPKIATIENQNEIAKVRLDFSGVNFYGPLRARKVTNKTEAHPYGNWFEFAIPDGARMNTHRGIEIYPQALYDVMSDIWNRHRIPLYCSENGVGVEEQSFARNKEGELKDDYRISFVKEHLVQLRRLIDDGVPVFGYHMWASMDCWSWINGFKNRYGFIELDLKTKDRRLKKSARWFAKLSKSGKFNSGFKPIEHYLNFKAKNFTPSK